MYYSFQSLFIRCHVRLFATPWTTAYQTSPSFTISQSSLTFMSTELVTPSNHLILCHPLLLLPSIFPSFRVFSNESVLHIRWPKYWSFSFSISPSNAYSGQISFRIDWLDLLAVQGTLKSHLQYHSSKASILWHSAFLIVQLSHPYMTTLRLLLKRIREAMVFPPFMRMTLTIIDICDISLQTNVCLVKLWFSNSHLWI